MDNRTIQLVCLPLLVVGVIIHSVFPPSDDNRQNLIQLLLEWWLDWWVPSWSTILRRIPYPACTVWKPRSPSRFGESSIVLEGAHNIQCGGDDTGWERKCICQSFANFVCGLVYMSIPPSDTIWHHLTSHPITCHVITTPTQTEF